MTILFAIGSVCTQSVANTDHCHRLKIESEGVLGGQKNRISRWTKNVRLATVGHVSENTRLHLVSLITRISLYTGLEIRLMDHAFDSAEQYLNAVIRSADYDMSLCSRGDENDCANFIVIFSSAARMHDIARHFPLRSVFQRALGAHSDLDCFFSPGNSQSLEIDRSLVFINRDLREEMQKTCLQEEIIQSFGIFNDVTNSRFYSFNNKSTVKRLTKHDYTLLSSLYDQALPTGALASPIVQQVLNYCSSQHTAIKLK